MRSRSGAISLPSSPNLQLGEGEFGMLVQAQEEGIRRGVTVLSTLTWDAEALAWQGLASAANLSVSGGLSFSDDTPEDPDWSKRIEGMDAGATSDLAAGAGKLAADGMGKIAAFLLKCWRWVQAKIEASPVIQRLVKLLGIGIDAVLIWVKKLLVDKGVIKQLFPFYGAVSGMIQGALQSYDAHCHRSVFRRLGDAAPHVASGIPSAALAAFRKFVHTEFLHTAAKATYTFAKTITSVLLTIFTMGISSTLDFVAACVEAIESFAYSLIQGVCFGRATEKCRSHIQADTMPTPEEFQAITAGSPFVGCVFFGTANYIGHFNLTAALSEPSRVLSSSSLMSSVAMVGEVQKQACAYVQGCSFDLKFRSAAEKERFGWLTKMMQGYANDAPKSELLTENASRMTKLRHYGRKGLRHGRQGFRKLFG